MEEGERRWLWVAWAAQLTFNLTAWVVTAIVIFFLFQGLSNIRDWWSIDTRNLDKKITALEVEIEALKRNQPQGDANAHNDPRTDPGPAGD